MSSKPITILYITLLTLPFALGCSDDSMVDTAPTLTEEDVARIVAEEISKIDIDAAVKRAMAEASIRQV